MHPVDAPAAASPGAHRHDGGRRPGVPTDAAVLAFQGVSVRYGGGEAPALWDCSFRLAAGERVALLGVNGSGKTTILMAAMGLVPHVGTIEVAGLPLEPARLAEVRDTVGFLFSVPEDQLLFPRVVDDVAFSLLRRGVPAAEAEQRARQTLAELGAEQLAERSPYRMSRGQRLRAALAGILVARPPLLLLDEPSSGLDPAGKRLLVRQLTAIPATTLIATHDLDFARQCCHRYILVHEGRIMAEGTSWDEVML
jgi:cobalt/nickel transport system ATP-binding protein